MKPWKPIIIDLEKWKTSVNPSKPLKTNMEPWKTNLEPSKLTWSWTGWLWGVQVVTGDSQEEVLIFRDTHTCIIIYISPSSLSSSSHHHCHHHYHHYHIIIINNIFILIICSPKSELNALDGCLGDHSPVSTVLQLSWIKLLCKLFFYLVL